MMIGEPLGAEKQNREAVMIMAIEKWPKVSNKVYTVS